MKPSITQRGRVRQVLLRLLVALTVTVLAQVSVNADEAAQRSRFSQAWNAGARGDHATLRRLAIGLEDYILYPYLDYEDHRVRRARIPADDMARFLSETEEWAFAAGLETAWLKTLGARRRWDDLLQHAEGSADTDVRCLLARARIERGRVDGLLAEVQSLWTVGKSQPDSCDPAFDWLGDQGGITPALARERIRLAVLAGNPRFALYVARFLPEVEQPWVEHWYELNRTRYRRLEQAKSWPDEAVTRMLASVSLQRLARHDADRAMRAYRSLEGGFGWDDGERGTILREIAFRGALSLSDEALSHMDAVPLADRDEQLLQWWARIAMARGEWKTVARVIDSMPSEARADGRWRYWAAIAAERLGDPAGARALMEPLSAEASYHGFLAADRLDRPYTICPQEPGVEAADIGRLRQKPDFARALELRRVEIGNWALAEWSLATTRLEVPELRAAAALAREEGWHDRAIFALGDSGDRRYYEWRFPLLWEQTVAAEAARNGLDVAWIHGVMRSESALSETARSPAGALGLMQVTPATARSLARRHGLRYSGAAQLREADHNIRFGTTFMRELLDRFGQNPVLAAGAYNAGPEAVERWLDERPAGEAAVWIENIPYFETRDYIPRVLAFTAIYDWRMGQPVTRISSRMPGVDSGKLGVRKTTEVVCLASG